VYVLGSRGGLKKAKYMNKVIRIVIVIMFNISVYSSYGQAIERYESIFILKFVKNTIWSSQKNVVNIGVLGNSKVLPELTKKVQQQKLKISVKKINYIDEVLDYDILFIPKSQNANIDKILQKVGLKEILLVAEDAKLSKKNVEISFFTEGNKLRFIINKTIATKKGISFSAQLLKYAEVI
jgi:hypothetical protein